jgi:uncharacterized membrane protein
MVSFLELFYDLVYVVVVSQAAHHLADHVSLRGVADFAVVFALIWIAWVNGSLYLELHGREDGRTRTIVFVQMGVLVLLAVYTADAAGNSGRGFALVYATFQALSTWWWYPIHREDRRDHPEFLTVTGRYVIGLGVSAVVMLASAALPAGPRVVVWAALVIAWIVSILVLGRSPVGLARGIPPTDSPRSSPVRFDRPPGCSRSCSSASSPASGSSPSAGSSGQAPGPTLDPIRADQLPVGRHPKVNTNASTSASRSSISNRLSRIGGLWRMSWYVRLIVGDPVTVLVDVAPMGIPRELAVEAHREAHRRS